MRLKILLTVFGGALLTGCVPPCDVDDLEPNDSAVSQLGVLTDAESEVELDLSLHNETDVDLLQFDVLDQGNDGNPEITITLDSYDEAMQVDILFECMSGPILNFQCAGAQMRETSVGCVSEGIGQRTIVLNYDCDSDDVFSDEDNSRVEVRVSRVSTTQTCSSYRFGVFVD